MRNVDSGHQVGPGRRVCKLDHVTIDRLDERRTGVIFRVVHAASRTRLTVLRKFTERGSKVADGVIELAVLLKDDRVLVFEVPVVEHRHHDAQPGELPRFCEWIVVPAPALATLDAVRPGFETNVLKVSPLGDRDFRNYIVDLGRVTDRP